MIGMSGLGGRLASTTGRMMGSAGRAGGWLMNHPYTTMAAAGAIGGYAAGGEWGAAAGGLAGALTPGRLRSASTQLFASRVFGKMSGRGFALTSTLAGRGTAGLGMGIAAGMGANLALSGIRSLGSSFGGMGRAPYGTTFSGMGGRY